MSPTLAAESAQLIEGAVGGGERGKPRSLGDHVLVGARSPEAPFEHLGAQSEQHRGGFGVGQLLGHSPEPGLGVDVGERTLSIKER